MSSDAPRPARILVLANETADTGTLADAIAESAAPTAEVLVVAPALNSRLRHWLSDEDDARRRAEVRLEGCVARLRSAGLHATGSIGDADPLMALHDALVTFEAEMLIIATHPEGRSNWLEANLVERARAVFVGPIRHVPVDTSRDRAFSAAV